MLVKGLLGEKIWISYYIYTMKDNRILWYFVPAHKNNKDSPFFWMINVLLSFFRTMCTFIQRSCKCQLCASLLEPVIWSTGASVICHWMVRPEQRPWTRRVSNWEASVGQSSVRIEGSLSLPYVIFVGILTKHSHYFYWFSYQNIKKSLSLSINNLWQYHLFLYRSFLWLRGVHIVSSVCGWWGGAGSIHRWVLQQWH